MASNRIGRINEEIQRELSSLFRNLKDPRVQGGMVTITHVDTTTDLRYCRVFVSVLDKTQEKDVIRGLKSAAGYLRRELGLPKEQVDAHGYWKKGEANLDHHAPLDPSDPD